MSLVFKNIKYLKIKLVVADKDGKVNLRFGRAYASSGATLSPLDFDRFRSVHQFYFEYTFIILKKVVN